MSLRLEMLQVARLAPKQLGDAAERVENFFRGQFLSDGGARDRDGESDLYYTVFAAEGLIALQADLPAGELTRYLTAFGDGDDLDLVHLTCLARCWAAMPGALPVATAAGIAQNLACFRSADGGYANERDRSQGTVYHAFLALGAHQDIGVDCPASESLPSVIRARSTGDHGYANDPDLPSGSTTVTAAAVTMLRQLEQPVPSAVGDWLLACAHPEGGFLAAPRAPLPDLLSTAAALHALAGMKKDFSMVREPCLDFIDSLWTGQAFCGHWSDDVQDSEYTYYALLALGHLSL
ncbi:MAG: prenyltransferase/squalene oxidase repeat-containing protein [Planctomycetota bacterium]|jgi:hypothetical protein|nr:prenyltransferase/squalene oxidase repeat-containing protein [Planctomycetota bacterium]